MNGTKLEVRTADGVVDCQAWRPDGNGPWPAVIFYMDALGIRPAMHQMAERLASHGYFVLLPNVFYRLGAFAPFDPKTVFDVPPERERLMGMVRQFDFAAAMRDTAAFLDALARQPGVRADRVGAVGYCLGGRLAFTAAGSYPDRIAAAASIHGSLLVTDHPDSPHRLAGRIRGQLYFGIADNDRSFTPEQRKQLEAALDAAHVRYKTELYPGALHGFAVPDVAAFDATAAERHWERVVALFREALPATGS